MFGIEGERELEGGRSACPALTRGIVLAEEDSASGNRGADSRRSVTPLPAASSAGRWGDSSDRFSVDRSASLECAGSPPGGLSGIGPVLCANCSDSDWISSAAPTAVLRASAAALVMMPIAIALLLGTSDIW